MTTTPNSKLNSADRAKQKNTEKHPFAKPLRIAVVDDEPLICDLLHESLTSLGHDVTCFARSEEALEATRFLFFDVILSDIKMRGMSGIELYERLRAENSTQAARALFITGDTMASATQSFFARYDCLYLRKPFRQIELCAKIEELLRRCSCSNETIGRLKAA